MDELRSDALPFGIALRDWRVKCGWSREELAAKLELSYSTICTYERLYLPPNNVYAYVGLKQLGFPVEYYWARLVDARQ